MATLTLYTCAQLAQLALLPVVGDAGNRALVSASQFGPFAAGDSLVVSSTQPFHVIAGTASTAVATTAHPLFPANVYHFVMPSGCTHVSMIDSSAGAGVGQVYKG
jgi:hypothetical protein